MSKIELIKKITEYHPANQAGRKRGWSHYVGGMADTGDWYFRKLLDASETDLQNCLNELIEEFKPKPEQIYTKQELEDKDTIVFLGPGIVSNMFEIKKFRELMEKQENTMLWGTQKK